MKLVSPCYQNYSTMPLKAEGRFCSECSKVVVDFRKKDEAEIKNYFQQHKNENVCGRMKSYQAGEESYLVRKIISLKKYVSEQINFTPLKLALLAMISGLMTFTTSCMGAVRPIEKQPIPAKDSVQTSKKVESEKK